MSAIGTYVHAGGGEGADISIDLDRLIGSHVGIIANSGGGKSGLLRRLLETTHGRVPHIVLDPEDEFYTLREKFDYVIAGGDCADVPATLANPESLAIAALEHKFSLIVQLNDLGEDMPEFVGRFLSALVGAPRELWHPVLVAIDEAHLFAPSNERTAASAGVRALTGRGRKRGFTAIVASQRISKVDADVRGDLNNWMLGRVGQSLDRNIMADQLGFTPSEGRTKLRMELRQFWAMGPAISFDPILFRVTDAETTVVRPGQAKVSTPPAPEALSAILSALVPPPAPLIPEPSNEGADAKRLADARVADLETEVAALREICTRKDARIAKAEVLAAPILQFRAGLERLNTDIAAIAERMKAQLAGLNAIPADAGIGGKDHVDRIAQREQTHSREAAAVKVSGEPRALSSTAVASPGDLPPRHIRILDSIAWVATYLNKPSADRSIVAWIADTSPKSSGYQNDLGALRTSGLIEYPAKGEVALTDAGRERATMPAIALARVALRDAIAAKLAPRHMRILDRLLAECPVGRGDLAVDVGISASSSGFQNDLGHLRSLGLIDYPKPGYVTLGTVWQRNARRG